MDKLEIIKLDEKTLEIIDRLLKLNEVIIKQNQLILDRLTKPMLIFRDGDVEDNITASALGELNKKKP